APTRAGCPRHTRRAGITSVRAADGRGTGRATAARPARLRALHLGVDRPTEGRAGALRRTGRAAAPPPGDDHGGGRTRRRAAAAGGAHVLVRLRLRDRPGDLAAVRTRTPH